MEPENLMLQSILNVELAPGEAPEWVELVPHGPAVTGRDGRSWMNDAPEGIVERFAANGAPIPIDWEHATEIRAENGESAPAAGWIEEMQVRDGGAVWGRVAWTPRGAEMVSNREYRYLSPVILFDKASLRIVAIRSAGLTNKPNLFLTALNRAREDKPMDKELLNALGLPETATVAEAINAVAALNSNLAAATNRARVPDLTKFVPRAQYDAMAERAANAEQKMRDAENTAIEGKITTALDAAVKDGKIPPATREQYAAFCRQEGGLENFTKLMDVTPSKIAESGLDGKPTPATGAAMNAEQRQINELLGIDDKTWTEFGPKQQ